MLNGPSLFRLRMALLVILSVALVATGWAHRGPDLGDEARAFLIATGSTPADLCGTGKDAAHSDPLCQACQIAGGAVLPTLAETPRPLPLVTLAFVGAPGENLIAARVLDLARPPQGPPSA